ncbi:MULTISPECIES: SRPBCC family protein [unclassified Arthrobacter]|uniref:SRPBCC family protein n=1 Tax=unclassified Arthrobacter TaxID=235627 RepID=UPI003425B75A
MAYAEHDVVIQYDAMGIYAFLLDPRNLPYWREGIESVALVSGAVGAPGSVYRPALTAGSFPPAAGDFELTAARPGAEIQFQVISGRARVHCGYYLSTHGGSTHVRFALRYRPGVASFLLSAKMRRAMQAQVVQLEQLKMLLEAEQAAA